MFSFPAVDNLAWALVPVFIAALVRGYTGFGFAAVAITGLNLIWPPQQSVPVILILDVIGTLGLLRGAWPDADRGVMLRLGSGALVGIPLGLTLLIQLPELALKLGISAAVLVMTLMLLRKTAKRRSERTLVTRFIGLISGSFTAAASVGGLPIVSYLLSMPLNARAQRATMVIFLAGIDLLALLLLWISGVIDAGIWTPIPALLLPTWLGVQLGQMAFQRRRPSSFHPVAVPVLVMLSLSGLGTGLYQLGSDRPGCDRSDAETPAGRVYNSTVIFIDPLRARYCLQVIEEQGEDLRLGRGLQLGVDILAMYLHRANADIKPVGNRLG